MSLATPATTSSQRHLHTSLDRALGLPAEYGDRLSSHLPMALHALHAMGADDAAMTAFFDAYSTRFHGRLAADPAEAHVLPDWTVALGRIEAFADLRRSLAAALAERGQKEVLAEVLPVLLPGLASVAFHGLIRTAHAVQSGHQAELAAALAYWASRWQTLPAPPANTLAPGLGSGRHSDLAAWSQTLVEQARAWRSEAPLIFLRMQDASVTPLYGQLAHALAPAPTLAQRAAELAHLALGYYLDSANFTVLHMITGLRALRVLMPWLPASWHTDPALQDLLGQAFVAAYMAGRVQRLRSGRERPPETGAAIQGQPLTWPDLQQAACRASDDHVIKLVHACGEEMAVYGDARYLQAAALALR